MLKSAPAKPPEKPRPAFSAFGVTVDTADKKNASEKAPMTRERKAMIGLAALVPLIALVLWLQYRPTNDLDSEAAANAGVREVVKLQEKKDTSGLSQLTKSEDPAVARRAVQAPISPTAVTRFATLPSRHWAVTAIRRRSRCSTSTCKTRRRTFASPPCAASPIFVTSRFSITCFRP